MASKFAISEVPALQVSYIRQFIAGTLFLVYFLLIKKQPLPALRDFRYMLVMSLLVFLMANGLSTWGLKYIPTGLASLIGALYPLSVVLIESVFFRKRNIKPFTLTGMLVGIIGVVFVFYENMFANMTPELFFGIGLSLVAMLAWSLGTVFLSRHQLSVDPYYSMGWQMIMGSVMVFVFAHVVQHPVPVHTISLKAWLAIFYLVIIGSVISFIAFIYTLRRLPAAISSLYAYINPIVATVIAALFLGEKLTFSIMSGTVITLAGVYMVNRSMKKEKEAVILEAEI